MKPGVSRLSSAFIIVFMNGIIGRNVGMGQVFGEDGRLIPVTYVACGKNVVVDVKTQERDGYESLVLGFEDLGSRATNTKKYRVLKEFRGDASGASILDEVLVSGFTEGDVVSLQGKSKGKGFQGRVRKHNASIARKTHGTKYIRHGSTGSICITARSQKGLKMAGRMGNDQVTLHNREVISVDVANGLIALQGPVPGAINSVVFLK